MAWNNLYPLVRRKGVRAGEIFPLCPGVSGRGIAPTRNSMPSSYTQGHLLLEHRQCPMLTGVVYDDLCPTRRTVIAPFSLRRRNSRLTMHRPALAPRYPASACSMGREAHPPRRSANCHLVLVQYSVSKSLIIGGERCVAISLVQWKGHVIGPPQRPAMPCQRDQPTSYDHGSCSLAILLAKSTRADQ